MSYTPTTWVTGDTVTATKLNKLEQGVANAGSALIVDVESGETLNKTMQEIYDALSAGTPVYIRWVYGDITDLDDYVANQWLCPVSLVYRYSTDVYRLAAIKGANTKANFDQMGLQIMTFSASSLSGYPVFANALNYPT